MRQVSSFVFAKYAIIYYILKSTFQLFDSGINSRLERKMLYAFINYFIKLIILSQILQVTDDKANWQQPRQNCRYFLCYFKEVFLTIALFLNLRSLRLNQSMMTSTSASSPFDDARPVLSDLESEARGELETEAQGLISPQALHTLESIAATTENAPNSHLVSINECPGPFVATP